MNTDNLLKLENLAPRRIWPRLKVQDIWKISPGEINEQSGEVGLRVGLIGGYTACVRILVSFCSFPCMSDIYCAATRFPQQSKPWITDLGS